MLYDATQLDELLVFQKSWLRKKRLWQMLFATADTVRADYNTTTGTSHASESDSVNSDHPRSQAKLIGQGGHNDDAELDDFTTEVGSTVHMEETASGVSRSMRLTDSPRLHASHAVLSNSYDDGLDEVDIEQKYGIATIYCIANISRLKLDTDFGKVIGRTEVVMSNMLARGIVLYDTPRTYFCNMHIDDITAGDQLKRLGLLGGSLSLSNILGGAFVCMCASMFVSMCVCMPVCMYMSACLSVCMDVCVYACMYVS
jgi:hypothetical protein